MIPISQVIHQLQQLQEREGDIPFALEGFFNEVRDPKFYIEHRSTKRDGFYHPQLDGDESFRGERVILASHL